MKKILTSAAVAAVLFTTSCLITDGGEKLVANDPQLTSLRIKLTGASVSGATRAVEASGTVDTENNLTDGHIFILLPDGETIYTSKPFTSDDVDNMEGGTYNFGGEKIPATSKVFVVGNIPDGMNMMAYYTLTEVKEASAAISAYAGTSGKTYQEVPLTNRGGTVAGLDIAGGVATAEIDLAPVISRVELHKITGGSSVETFTVTGVFLTDVYSDFTLGGSYDGTEFKQPAEPEDEGGLVTTGGTHTYDAGSWMATSAVADTAPYYATPETTPGSSGEVWAYNVAAGSLPLIWIRLENITTLNGTEDVLTAGPKYLKITKYTTDSGSTQVTEFEPGVIYSIANIVFTPGNLGIANENVTITANVEKVNWVPQSTDPVVPDQTMYSLSVNQVSGGTVTAKVYQEDGQGPSIDLTDEDACKFPANRQITITATPDANYKFTTWTTFTGLTLNQYQQRFATFTLTMPESNVTLTPSWDAVVVTP